MSDNTVGRLFLKNFQVLQNVKLNNSCILKDSAEFTEDIKKIDCQLIRHVQLIPFLYYKNVDSRSYETNYMEDTSFNDLLNSMGLVLDEKHVKTGNFDHIRNHIVDTGIVYNSSFLYEQLFVVPSLKLQNPAVII